MTAQPKIPADRNLGDLMLTLQEVCAILREPEGTLRHVRYWKADVVLWLAEQTNRPQGRP